MVSVPRRVVRSVADRWFTWDTSLSLGRIPLFDVVVGVVFVGLTVVSFSLDRPLAGIGVAWQTPRPTDLVSVLVLLGKSAPLVFRRSHPGLMFTAVCAAGIAGNLFQVQPSPSDFGFSLAVYSFCAFTTANVILRRILPTAVFLVELALVFLQLGDRTAFSQMIDETKWTLLFEPVIGYFSFVLIWQLGGELRRYFASEASQMRRQALDAEERRLQAEVAILAQRKQLARELHDSVGHKVTLLILQADAMRVEADEPGRQNELATLAETGREALAELRELVGVLGMYTLDERSPIPTLADIDSVIAPVQALGLDVRLHVVGSPTALSAAANLSACRVVQEALTNVLRHASARTVDVTIRYGERDVEVVVEDDGRGAVQRQVDGSGLRGLRERAQVLGGGVEAGDRPGGGFRLKAWFPHSAISASVGT